ncbi:hypothetical protein EV643_103507 [Kribbella sp. VKM Ac-2527]|uniref:Uncharacterized protein n=1 Tax=Kribbella caucasensis TaxID=2512215 RepID=A0A4R6KKB3_9ACTN|nr:hypothetical protein EV643_103507 [Kribbella sp. VKM Ac-2527]
MNRIASQYHACRRTMTMLWIERVRSAPYQSANVTASAAANTAVVSSSGTPIESVRLSVIKVPATDVSTTTGQ